MATYTADKAKSGVSPRAVHAGTNTIVSTFTWGVTNADDATTSATAAAADVIRICKLPHGATVTRVAYTGNAAADVTSAIPGSIKVGVSASTALFDGNVSFSQGVTEALIGLPYTVSISDDASVAYEYLIATVLTAGATLSDQMQFIVNYVMDN